MNTKTYNYRFDNITFELTELREYCQNHDRNASIDNALARAIELSKSADQDLFTREALLAILIGLRNLEDNAIPADDLRMVMIRRVMANAYRADGNFAEAELLARSEPTDSLITLAVVASDIRAQKDPERNPQALTLYIKALKAGLEELEKTIWPSNVRAEIASIYVSMAEVLLEMNLPAGAEAQMENLIAFNNKAVADYNIANGVPYQMLDAFKLMMTNARQYTEKGMPESAARLIEKGLELAALGLKQTNYDVKVVRVIMEVWDRTLGTLIASSPAFLGAAAQSSSDQTTNVPSAGAITSSRKLLPGRRFFRP